MVKPIGFLDILRSKGSLGFKCAKLLDCFLGGLLAYLLPAKPALALPVGDSIKSVLVIRPGGLGDAVFLLKILRSYKEQYPKVQVDVLCQQRNAEVFRDQACVRDILLLERIGDLGSLFNNSYDVVIDAEQWHYLSGVIAYLMKASLRIGFATRDLRAKLFNHQAAYDVNGYELINFIELFKPIFPQAIGIKGINGAYQVSEGLQDWAKDRAKEPLAVVALGASIAERRLTVEQNVQLLKQLLAKGYCPVLLGGKDVLQMGGEICKQIDGVDNLAGQLGLAQSAALIGQAKLFIGPDSGLLHLAVALGTPTLSFFGPGNADKWAPQGEHDKVINLRLPCSPCTRFGYTLPTCQGKVMCMRDLKLDYNIK